MERIAYITSTCAKHLVKGKGTCHEFACPQSLRGKLKSVTHHKTVAEHTIDTEPALLYFPFQSTGSTLWTSSSQIQLVHGYQENVLRELLRHFADLHCRRVKIDNLQWNVSYKGLKGLMIELDLYPGIEG